MYLLLWVVLSGSTFGIPLSELATDKERYELPGESIPTLYDVRLFLDPSQDTNFFGNVSINIIPVIETDTIVLHAMEISIDGIQVYNDNDTETDLLDDFTLAEDDTHLLTIRLNEQISPMEFYTIHIDFVGQYDDDSVNGIYITSYQTGNQTEMISPARALNPDIESIIFCSCLRGGSADNFYFLWDQFATSTDDALQDIFLEALGCTSDPILRDFFLKQTIDSKVQVHDHQIVTIISSVIRSSPENTDAALDFFIEHFTVIHRRVHNPMTNFILTQFFKRLNTQRHNAKVEELCRLHENELTDEHLETIASIREYIEASTIWTNKNLVTVEAWLRFNYESNATALTSTIFSLLSTLKSVSNLIGSIQSNIIPSAFDAIITKDD